MGAAPVPPFTDLATPFDRIAEETEGQPAAQRIAAILAAMDQALPGLYQDSPRTEARIGQALEAQPSIRAAYRKVVAGFPESLDAAVARFRGVFPGFRSPLPIYLVHSLGMRDGGSEYLKPGHRKVMLFGADMIARLHRDGSLQPFLAHELFHLEHARRFLDCDPLWCGLWQEGLAVLASERMLPGASEADLLLTQPRPIRAAADAAWSRALCFVAAHFDDGDPEVVSSALTAGAHPPGLPDRIGYYVGLRLAEASGLPLRRLTGLDNRAARSTARRALAHLLDGAGRPCAPPPRAAPITRAEPRPA